MPSRVPRSVAFWSVTVVLLLVLAASGAPSPLYRVYQEQLGFSDGVLTLVFGIYSFGLLAALLVVGALSDHIGRRPVVVAALLLQAVGMVLFLLADSTGWLLAARAVQGLSMGALTGSLGAALLDFQRSDRPLGALVNSASPGPGLSIGAVGAGLLVDLVADPTSWVFGFLTVALVVAAGVVLLLPESSPRRPGALRSLRPQVHVPRPQRPAFLLVLPSLVATWSLGGLYLALGPSLTAEVFDLHGSLVGGLLILAMQGTAAIGSISARGLSGERAMATGALVLAGGVAVTVVALLLGSVPVFFLSAVISGLGFGATFLGAVGMVTRDVAPGERAGLLSSLFVVGYLSYSLPAIAAGIAAGRVGLELTAVVYGVVVIVLALLAVAGLAVRRRAPGRSAPTPEDEPAQPLAA